MNLLFLGSGEFGLPTLSALAGSHDILAVVTQPDRPAGRGRELAPTPIGAWTAANRPDVPLFKPHKINEPEVVARLRAFNADAWVVIAFGQKLGKPLLDGVFAINLHASLLPRWRGAAPINAAILAGDTLTGNTVITLADRMDAGEILAQSTHEIDPAATAGELHDLLSAEGPALVEQVLSQRAAGTLQGRAQHESLATKAAKLSRADAWVDFNQPAEACRRRVHGLTPWPGVSVRLIPPESAVRDLARIAPVELKLTRVHAPGPGAPIDPSEGPPPITPDVAIAGTLIDPEQGLVLCGHATVLAIQSVTPAGKRPMAWSAFAQGRSIHPGSRLEGVTRT